ncbi:MAG: Gfo/Idh/MocA family oxidoreductase [Bacteroidales bacterium]|nr:Gfo/Idh/MocA family oxidoreductase [Bacteroidales bacterium]
MKRREFLRNAGLLAAGSVIAPELVAKESMGEMADIFNPETTEDGELNDLFVTKPLKADVNRVMTVAIVGAGSRGNTYARYAKKFPSVMKIVGAADINPVRLKKFAERYDLPADKCFNSADEFFTVPKFADIVVISTPDDVHYVPTMKALQAGYHVLLEKPMCQTEKECRDILAMTKKTGGLVAVCHVLRYAPYFMAMREAIKRGMIGDIVSVQHLEPIQYSHMAHSYVRGNWRSSKQTTPIILAKSCHDLDIIRYLVGKPCETIVADGSLYLFKKENAPEGAPLRCLDGCPHEKDCPYNAVDIYLKKRRHLQGLRTDFSRQMTDEEIMTAIKTGPYGRCVYHCDNDQPDHYVANMVFQDGITASFSMEAFTPSGGRRTRIMGTRGYIDGDGHQFTLTEFGSMKMKVWNKNVDEIPEYKDSGHGGGDHGVLRDLLEAVCWNDESRLTSTVAISVESHVMGFDAEKSRKNGKKMKVRV